MITGDHATTAAAIGAQLGIEGEALTGAEFAALSDEELGRRLDDIGVVARVAPEDKVRLVELLQRQGNVVAMTGDGVNDAPALRRADIGVAMGITGTEVTKEAGDMILTDDNFATIVTAVDGGRGLYDNLMKYVRVQLVMLGGFILTFLGAAIFDIAGGAPLTPLQILWVNFAIDLFLAVGLGFDAPVPGLMQRLPRDAAARIVSRPLAVRLTLASICMAGLALAIVGWGEARYDLITATTMGLTTLSLMHVIAALEAREPKGTVFARYTIENWRFLQMIGAAGRTHVAGHGPRGSAADLRNRFADEPAMGDLPARPDRAAWPAGAREVHRAPNRPAARRASQTTSVIQLAAISHPAMTSVVQ
jgi:Ca2+-transporting ATPase